MDFSFQLNHYFVLMMYRVFFEVSTGCSLLYVILYTIIGDLIRHWLIRNWIAPHHLSLNQIKYDVTKNSFEK